MFDSSLRTPLVYAIAVRYQTPMWRAGALLLARGLRPVPGLPGGGQESDVRSGTLDAPAIRGFAVAAQLAVKRRDDEAARLAALRDDLIARILAAVPDAQLNGAPPGPGRLPGGSGPCRGMALLCVSRSPCGTRRSPGSRSLPASG